MSSAIHRRHPSDALVCCSGYVALVEPRLAHAGDAMLISKAGSDEGAGPSKLHKVSHKAGDRQYKTLTMLRKALFGNRYTLALRLSELDHRPDHVPIGETWLPPHSASPRG